MPFKYAEDRRAYALRWIQQRRADWIREHGLCAVCGSSDRLQVDHIDPSKKLTHKVWSWSLARRLKELEKCQVLCEKHHKQKTAKYRARALFHGNASMYRKGCRCDLCREAASTQKAEWRLSTGKH
jgi:5-methylcytosine-specific restriction endonuclease McrA